MSEVTMSVVLTTVGYTSRFDGDGRTDRASLQPLLVPCVQTSRYSSEALWRTPMTPTPHLRGNRTISREEFELPRKSRGSLEESERRDCGVSRERWFVREYYVPLHRLRG